MSLLDRLALDAPVVVAIDDLQWLDVSSAETVRFAARRLTGPVGVLATERRADRAAERAVVELRHPERLLRLRLGPLASEDVRRLLSSGPAARLVARPSIGSTTPPAATLSWRSSSLGR